MFHYKGIYVQGGAASKVADVWAEVRFNPIPDPTIRDVFMEARITPTDEVSVRDVFMEARFSSIWYLEGDLIIEGGYYRVEVNGDYSAFGGDASAVAGDPVTGYFTATVTATLTAGLQVTSEYTPAQWLLITSTVLTD